MVMWLKVRRFLINVLILIDEAGNTLTLGDPGETISSRAAKAQAKGKQWGCVLCRFLDLFQKNHCQKSVLPQAGVDAVIPD